MRCGLLWRCDGGVLWRQQCASDPRTNHSKSPSSWVASLTFMDICKNKAALKRSSSEYSPGRQWRRVLQNKHCFAFNTSSWLFLPQICAEFFEAVYSFSFHVIPWQGASQIETEGKVIPNSSSSSVCWNTIRSFIEYVLSLAVTFNFQIFNVVNMTLFGSCCLSLIGTYVLNLDCTLMKFLAWELVSVYNLNCILMTFFVWGFW